MSEGIAHLWDHLPDAIRAKLSLARREAAGTGGSPVTVYRQEEVMKDLFDATDTRGVQIIWNAVDVHLRDINSESTWLKLDWRGQRKRLHCDFIAGCDGHHGVSHAHIPGDALKKFERVYPFGWLGVRADVPSVEHDLIYANLERGFALASMRSRTRNRYYIQCALDEKIEDWPNGRFWDELCLRLGPKTAAKLVRRPSFEKAIAPLRSSGCGRAATSAEGVWRFKTIRPGRVPGPAIASRRPTRRCSSSVVGCSSGWPRASPFADAKGMTPIRSSHSFPRSAAIP